MGSLKPGATYIYERADGVTYAREMGADPNTRVAIGWDYDPINGHAIDKNKKEEDILWRDIRRASLSNPTLRDAVERVKMLYYLSKEKDAT